PPRRLVLRELAVAGWISLHHCVRGAHRQHRVVAVSDPPIQDFALEVTQGRAHGLVALPELDEMLVDFIVREARLDQPRAQVLEPPSIERKLANIVLVENPTQVLRDEAVIHRAARRRLQEPLAVPYVIWNPIRPRLLHQSIAWKPERRVYLPHPVNTSDQH